jgi:hypothetical protein
VERAANLCGMPRFADDWVAIAYFLRGFFKVHIPKEQWKALLHPKRLKPIGPVVDAIAERAWAPAMEREFEGGVRLNAQAAAFRTMLLILEDAGLAVGHLTPSSKLRPLLVWRPTLITHVVSRIAPGRLPPLHEVNLSFRAGLAGVIIAGAIWYLNSRMGHPWMEATAWVSFIVGIGSLMLSRVRAVMSIRLGELTTLGDVCYVLTTPEPDLPPPLPPEEDGYVPRWDVHCHPQYEVSALAHRTSPR